MVCTYKLFVVLSVTKTTDKSTDSVLQDIIPISSDSFKDTFLHLGGKLSDLPDLKKRTFVVEIVRRWGKYIIKKGARIIAYLRGGPRMDQGWRYIVFFCLFFVFMRQVYPKFLYPNRIHLHLGVPTIIGSEEATSQTSICA